MLRNQCSNQVGTRRGVFLLFICLVLLLASVVTLPSLATAAPAPITTTLDFNVISTTDKLAAEGWSWNRDTKLLILNGLDLYTGASASHAIQLPADSTIELRGSNSILVETPRQPIHCDGNLIIKGPGSIDLSTTQQLIYAHENLIICEGATVTQLGERGGISVCKPERHDKECRN
ncbi:MAG: hypothetical protein FWE46_02270 [Coriobacteriia bacterium]|nr:hypothetical protein [Coriobacteriia bacterium]MCL2537145.1 hypothetical protein [Coriobacteriia bacterium]